MSLDEKMRVTLHANIPKKSGRVARPERSIQIEKSSMTEGAIGKSLVLRGNLVSNFLLRPGVRPP